MKANTYNVIDNKIGYVKQDSFSYADIPHYFENILGVTGTLQTLDASKKSQSN